jgi:hypothetical protein
MRNAILCGVCQESLTISIAIKESQPQSQSTVIIDDVKSTANKMAELIKLKRFTSQTVDRTRFR